MSDETPVFAVIRSVEEMQRILRARAEQIGIRREDIDELSGLPSGYAGKVFCIPPMRRIDRMSMFLLAGALGCGIALVEDKAALKRAKQEARRRKFTRKPEVHWRNAKAFGMIKEMAVTNGQIGGRKRAQSLTSEHQSKAAKARWRKWRRARRLAALTDPNLPPVAQSAPSVAAVLPRTREPRTRRPQSAAVGEAKCQENQVLGSRSTRRDRGRA